jgi:hypothetical protein
MITYLVTREGESAIRNNALIVGTELEPYFEIVRYEDALQRGDWHTGTIVFADLERIYASAIPAVTRLWRRFENARAPVRLLNHPTRSLKRYALLRRLHEMSLNAFNVYRGDEHRKPERFPVFLHGERDHNGPMTGVLETPEALAAALDGLADAGVPLNQVLVTEFCDVRSADGLYRKYGAFIVGGRVVPRHLFFSANWSVKTARDDSLAADSEETLLEEERAFVFGNPHESELGTYFGIAGIEYGRMDYGLRDGRIQVWEINTNPLPLSPLRKAGDPRFDRVLEPMNDKIRAALLALDGARDDQPFWIDPVRVPPAVAALGDPKKRVGVSGGGWRSRLLRR